MTSNHIEFPLQLLADIKATTRKLGALRNGRRITPKYILLTRAIEQLHHYECLLEAMQALAAPSSTDGPRVETFSIIDAIDLLCTQRFERMDRFVLGQIICELFDHRQYYDLQELLLRTSQPRIWLKEILEVICDFHETGPNAGCYSMKTAYHLYSQLQLTCDVL